MSVKIIIYYPYENKGDLIAKIKSYSNYAGELGVWLVKTPDSPTEIYERLSPTLTENDQLMVLTLGPGYHGRIPQSLTNWLERNLV